MHGVLRIEMWSCSGAALGKISEFVDVNPMFSIRIEPSGKAGNFGGDRDVLLTEGHDTSNVGVAWIQDADGMTAGVRSTV